MRAPRRKIAAVSAANSCGIGETADLVFAHGCYARAYAAGGIIALSSPPLSLSFFLLFLSLYALRDCPFSRQGPRSNMDKQVFWSIEQTFGCRNGNLIPLLRQPKIGSLPLSLSFCVFLFLFLSLCTPRKPLVYIKQGLCSDMFQQIVWLTEGILGWSKKEILPRLNFFVAPTKNLDNDSVRFN